MIADIDDRVHFIWAGHRCSGIVTGIDRNTDIYSVLLRNKVTMHTFSRDIIRVIKPDERAPT